MSSYTIVIHKADEGGSWADVPALEGCFAHGETVGEVTEDLCAPPSAPTSQLSPRTDNTPVDEGILVRTVQVAAVA